MWHNIEPAEPTLARASGCHLIPAGQPGAAGGRPPGPAGGRSHPGRGVDHADFAQLFRMDWQRVRAVPTGLRRRAGGANRPVLALERHHPGLLRGLAVRALAGLNRESAQPIEPGPDRGKIEGLRLPVTQPVARARLSPAQAGTRSPERTLPKSGRPHLGANRAAGAPTLERPPSGPAGSGAGRPRDRRRAPAWPRRRGTRRVPRC